MSKLVCKANTKRGDVCKNHAMKGSEYCYVHSFGRFKRIPIWKNASVHFIVTLVIAILIFVITMHKGASRINQEKILRETGTLKELIRPVASYFDGSSVEPARTLTPKPQNLSYESKTLHDLFLSDFNETSMRGEYNLTKNNEVVYTVQYIIWCDFDTKTKYLSVFFPKSDYTFSACMFLAKEYNDILYGNIMSLMKRMIHQAPAEHAETYDELLFSGRIYVYHETYLLPSRVDSLREEYKKQNLSPQFRGRDYLIMKNSPLYEQ